MVATRSRSWSESPPAAPACWLPTAFYVRRCASGHFGRPVLLREQFTLGREPVVQVLTVDRTAIAETTIGAPLDFLSRDIVFSRVGHGLLQNTQWL
jgi:hypothetical protein